MDKILSKEELDKRNETPKSCTNSPLEKIHWLIHEASFSISKGEIELAQAHLSKADSMCHDEVNKWQSEWISVEEKLPEESGQYLCYVSGPAFYQGLFVFDRYALDAFLWRDSFHFANVTHWQALPAPPKQPIKQ